MAFLNGGQDAERHAKKYLDPYFGKLDTHNVKCSFIPETEKVSILSWFKKDKYFVNILYDNNKYEIPFSKIIKPKIGINRGLTYENEILHLLHANGLYYGNGGGCTGSNDFSIFCFNGEVKRNLRAAFGQASLHYNNGWHISDKAREKFPLFAKSIEYAKCDNVSLLEKVNSSFGPPEPKRVSTNIYSSLADLKPAHSYLKDHDVDILHIGSHGTFRGGLSFDKNRTPLDLPVATGAGLFRVRNKHFNSLTVQFCVKECNTSEINIEKQEHIDRIKANVNASGNNFNFFNDSNRI
jgi:hypothetical protein